VTALQLQRARLGNANPYSLYLTDCLKAACAICVCVAAQISLLNSQCVKPTLWRQQTMKNHSVSVIEGVKAFQHFLHSERSRFSSAPILLLASVCDAQHGKPDKRVDEACRYTKSLFQQQMPFRTVVSHPMSGYVFPTLSDLENATVLAARVGATTVVAVGSGGVVDLAKAVSQSMPNKIDELVLVPATHAATMASASSSSLLLDPTDETLSVYPFQGGAELQATGRTIALMEYKNDIAVRFSEALYACMALKLDVLLRTSNVDEIAETHLAEIVKLLDSDQDSQQTMALSKMLVQVGREICYGLDGDPRSSPLALAVALLPTEFPQYGMLTFLASVAKPISHELLMDKKVTCIDALNLSAAPKALTTQSSVETLMAKIHENQAEWGCRDLPDEVLSSVLKEHVI
jgi:hypothetical protein